MRFESPGFPRISARTHTLTILWVDGGTVIEIFYEHVVLNYTLFIYT